MRKILIILIILLVQRAAFANLNLQSETIDSLRQKFIKHELSCTALVTEEIAQIKRYNLDLSRGAAINAFVSLNPSVYEQAKELDLYQKKNNHLIGPLHCIPIVVKDNIDTITSPTTSGSLALIGSQPVKDAVIVKKLKQAGAIIIGKGSMDEFASGISGMSTRSGRIGNAVNPTMNPGGSSGGVAAAVSAGFAVAGIGTDNSGSVRIPAAFNGAVGLRPSMGLISQTGIVPRGNIDGTAGPIARNLSDLSQVLAVISQPDRTDKNALMLHKNLKDVNIGIIKSVTNMDPYEDMPTPVRQLFAKLSSRLNNMGANIKTIELNDFDGDRQDNRAGEYQQMNEYLSSFPSTRKSYEDICQSGRTMVFGSVDNCLKDLKDIPRLNGKIYKSILARFENNRKIIEKQMQAKRIDILLIPVSRVGIATYDIEKINSGRMPVSSNSGLPSLVLPIGIYRGMPVAVEVIGKFNTDPQLISLAKTIEDSLNVNSVPKLHHAKSNLNKLSIPEYNNLLSRIGFDSFKHWIKGTANSLVTVAEFNESVRRVSNLGNDGPR